MILQENSKEANMKMKQMKLEGALKLYTVLYFLAFLLTFMMSVPMLKHVMPQSKCLLFVQVFTFTLIEIVK